MNIEEFQKRSTRTMDTSLTRRDQIANMALGIAGESGEVADIIKKHLYQGHTLDLDHMKEEIGDVMFYIVNLCTLYDITMSEVLVGNYNKLMERFPNGFDKEKSINR